MCVASLSIGEDIYYYYIDYLKYSGQAAYMETHPNYIATLDHIL
jgi:hypothetical protein